MPENIFIDDDKVWKIFSKISGQKKIASTKNLDESPKNLDESTIEIELSENSSDDDLDTYDLDKLCSSNKKNNMDWLKNNKTEYEDREIDEIEESDESDD